MAKHKTRYAIGVLFCLGLSLTALLSLAAPALNISTAQSPTLTARPEPENPDLLILLNSIIADEKCVLPCWWGWTVGEDNLETLQTIAMQQFGKEFEVIETSEESFPSGDDRYVLLFTRFPEVEAPDPNIDDEAIGVDVRLWVEKESDSLVAIALNANFSYQSYLDLSPYSAANILSRYGTPNKINIVYPGESGGYDDDYYLKLNYYDLGLYIRYWIYMKIPPQNLRQSILLCNSLENVSRITIWIEPKAFELSQEMIFAGGSIRTDTALDRSIEDIAPFTLEEFYETISQENTCVETFPINEWAED